MSPEKRIRNLSTRWLEQFKRVFMVLYSGMFIGMTYFFMYGSNGEFRPFGSIMVLAYGWSIYLLFRLTKNLYRVEFDSEFLYVIRKNQDLIIPLENIESVEISTVGGVYKVNLYHADQVGKEFYFKQSLWYPLNYRRCDDLVNVLRKNIMAAKRKNPVVLTNALHS